MYRLMIYLTFEQEETLLQFFMDYPQICAREHYCHTRSPLDNLGHYMWEELHEEEHESIVHTNQTLSDDQIWLWMEQELTEHRLW